MKTCNLTNVVSYSLSMLLSSYWHEPKTGQRIYDLYTLDFQRPASIIASGEQPASNAAVAAPILKEWALNLPCIPRVFNDFSNTEENWYLVKALPPEHAEWMNSGPSLLPLTRNHSNTQLDIKYHQSYLLPLLHLCYVDQTLNFFIWYRR